MSVKTSCIKPLILKSPKSTPPCAEVFAPTSLAFHVCTKCSHHLPPKPPSDFIKSWINATCLEPRLFLSYQSTAKICPLHFLPRVPIPTTHVPAGSPSLTSCSLPGAHTGKRDFPSRFCSTTDSGYIIQTHSTPPVQEGYLGPSPEYKLRKRKKAEKTQRTETKRHQIDLKDSQENRWGERKRKVQNNKKERESPGKKKEKKTGREWLEKSNKALARVRIKWYKLSEWTQKTTAHCTFLPLSRSSMDKEAEPRWEGRATLTLGRG